MGEVFEKSHVTRHSASSLVFKDYELLDHKNSTVRSTVVFLGISNVKKNKLYRYEAKFKTACYVTLLRIAGFRLLSVKDNQVLVDAPFHQCIVSASGHNSHEIFLDLTDLSGYLQNELSKKKECLIYIEVPIVPQSIKKTEKIGFFFFTILKRDDDFYRDIFDAYSSLAFDVQIGYVA